MDPYEFAQKQGQVIGEKPADDGPADGVDLLDMLNNAYRASYAPKVATEADEQAVAAFIDFGRKYLEELPVVSTGVVDGAFSLVFQGGVAVPVVAAKDTLPRRPDPTIPITRPKEQKMKGMPVQDTSVPITGRAPQRKPR